MADKIGSRKCSSFKAVSTAPDFCKTPVGSSTPPLPYQVMSDLEQSVLTVPNVRFNGKPCHVLDQSIVPTCTGDEPGTAKGVKSGTIKGKVEPTSASGTVRAGKKRVVRERDTNTMNNGNCPGIYVTQPAPGCAVSAGGSATQDTNPPPTRHTLHEKTFLEKIGGWWDRSKLEMKEAVAHPWEGVKGAGKGIANLVPQMGEMLIKGSALQGAGEIEQAAAMQSLLGNAQTAEQLHSTAEGVRQGADQIHLPQFEMSNPAQEGGDKIATGIQLAMGVFGIVKGGARAGVKMAAKAGRKEAGAGAEVAGGAKGMSKGDGVRVSRKTSIWQIGKSLNREEAKRYYKELGWSDAKIESHLNGIDFSRPVTVEKIPRGTVLEQWVDPKRGTGNYFTLPGTPATELGIYQGNRVCKSFVATEDIYSLRSTAASINDTWSVAGHSFPTKGGGTQYFVKNPGLFANL